MAVNKKMPTSKKMGLWKSPSGRLHWDKMCSGGGGYRNVRVRLTAEEYEAGTKCRCCPEKFLEGRERSA